MPFLCISAIVRPLRARLSTHPAEVEYMRKMLLGFVCVLGLLLAASCGDESQGSSTGSEDGTADESTIDGLVIPEAGTPDVGPEEVYVPEPGKFGYPCDENNDCDDEWCIATADGKVCTQTCIDECPQGWACEQVSATGNDLIYACVPNYAQLCNPCSTHEDCIEFSSQAGNLCIDHGPLGKFCGAKCTASNDCPAGYDCLEVPIDGEIIKQCYPVEPNGAPRTCSCSKLAANLGLSTSCYSTNDFGICYGYRECKPSGITNCSAEIPGVEVCNGMDDNCDNQVDNISLPEPCEVKNEHGICVGVLHCTQGLGTGTCDAATPAPEICDGIDQNCNGFADDGFTDTDKDLQMDCVDEDDDNDGVNDDQDNCPFDVNPGQENNEGDDLGDACDPDDDNDGHPDLEDCDPFDANVNSGIQEICDGLDNDCDNLVDEDLCDDANMCTDDKCQTDGTCVHTPNTKLCDDQSVCTQTDVCKESKCTGLSPINCNDNNQCTDDSCDTVAGCQNPLNSAGCEDGNPCTLNDVCSGGQCKPGQFDKCNDNNPCTADACSPLTGCKNTPSNNGAPCSTGSGQCGQGICTQGFCKSTDGTTCSTGNGTCPQGTCSGGSCFINSGQICEAKVDACIIPFCSDKVYGECTANGKCVPKQNPNSTSCGSPCPGGFCTKCCGIEVCIKF
ncbi:MAG TPA: hypothetical protein EYN66_06940 [Myxococcales bacterium]|nr:hypothetical protein [Myxococcales bacterium]